MRKAILCSVIALPLASAAYADAPEDETSLMKNGAASLRGITPPPAKTAEPAFPSSAMPIIAGVAGMLGFVAMRRKRRLKAG